ncbi:MAG: F0F1 ATP synthase subunit B [Planctomycetes bacterium]|nr:F0F1 ATP synthase subunit B [Planctomycetota bacterium]
MPHPATTRARVVSALTAITLALALLAAASATTLSAFATEKPAAAAHGEGATPEAPTREHKGELLDIEPAPLLITVAVFVLLVLILGKFAWRPIVDGLEAREKRIHDAIAEAEKRLADANRTMAEYENRLLQAKTEAHAIIDEGKRDAHAVKEKMLRDAKEEADAIRRRTTRDLALAREKAVEELLGSVGDLAAEIAGRMIRQRLTPRDHQDLIKGAIEEFRAASTAGKN